MGSVVIQLYADSVRQV